MSRSCKMQHRHKFDMSKFYTHHLLIILNNLDDLVVNVSICYADDSCLRSLEKMREQQSQCGVLKEGPDKSPQPFRAHLRCTRCRGRQMARNMVNTATPGRYLQPLSGNIHSANNYTKNLTVSIVNSS